MTLPILVQEFWSAATPARHRTFQEFAEQEIVMPGGPRKGYPFSCDFMAFSGEILREFTLGRFTDFYGSGPVQGGKTTLFYVIPSLYHAFELEEDVILGAPVLEMAQASYRERLLPAILSSRYKRLLPRTGHTPHKGTMSIRFRNGASVRFMGAHGGDEKIASYTSRVVVATELDKMDLATEVSRETDPVSKLKARTKSFGAAARFYGECTMSVKTGRIYREVVELGSDSRVYLQCGYCREWIFPERSGLVGWQEAEDVLEARTRVAYQCPKCQKLWNEFDRQRAIRNPRVVARGQEVTPEGEVRGELPRTLTYGFRWNQMASPLVTMAEIAKDEWEAARNGDQAKEKGIVQYVWTEPWEEEIADLSRPEVGTILQKIAGHARGVVPPETAKLTLGIDVGSYVIWWTLVAWRADAQGHVVDFGGIDVPLQGGVKNPTAVLAALRTFRENVINPGWGGRRPDRILIDSGYEQDVVYQFVRESGQPRYLACKGFGTSSRHGGWRDLQAAEPSPTRTVGTGYFSVLQPAGVHLVHVNADHFKAAVHDGFWAAHGAPGSLTVWHGEKNDRELAKFARMIVAEQRVLKTVGEKEPKVVWAVQNRTNHYLDTAAYARCAAEIEGIRLAAPRLPGKLTTKSSHAEPGQPLKWSRDKY